MWAAIAGIALNAFTGSDETASGQPASRGESIASKIFTQSTQDMEKSGAFFTDSRNRQRQKTKEEDPTKRIMAAMFAEAEKNDKGLPDFTRNLA